MHPTFEGPPSGDQAKQISTIFSQPFKVALAVALGGLAIYAWWPRLMPKVSSVLPARPQFFSPVFGAKNEHAWMAKQIGREILEVVVYAKTHKLPAEADVKFDAATHFESNKHRLSASFRGAQQVQVELLTQGYFWAPETFEPWANALLKELKANIPTAPAPLDGEYANRLTTPRPEVLIGEDIRISEALTKSPLDAGLHEEAALLIGSFALREAAASFSDIRRELCAISANLSLAKALRGELSAYGNLAEAVLCSLSGRQAPAIDILASLERQADTSRGLPLATTTIWARALRMFNTGDYRSLDQPEHASLLERLEYFRALRYSIGSAAASTFAAKHPLERLSEWSARILAGSFSVEEGHVWAPRAIATALDECATGYRSYHGKPLEPNELVPALNRHREALERTEAGSAVLHVIGWGGWAELHQRQLCELIESTWIWLSQKWGVKEEAAEFQKEFTRQFKGLDRFSLICFITPKDRPQSTEFEEQIAAFCTKHPELVTYEQWHESERNAVKSLPRPAPGQRTATPKYFQEPMKARSWFEPIFPIGTTYDINHRAAEHDLTNLKPAELANLKRIAPYSRLVLWGELRRSTNFRPTAEQTTAQFSELSAYNVWAMRVIANAVHNDPERYQQIFERICRYEPDRYIELADYLVDHGADKAAAKAYQNAFDHAPDRVYVANNCEWLVTYYFNQGRKDEAFKIAEHAAEVYSSRGLATMANLLERSGKLDEAEDYLKKIQTRYSDDSGLGAFYARNKDKSPRYAAAAQALTAKVFPKGLERVALAELDTAPQDGVSLTNSSLITEKIGLKMGDVFVALDGLRIRNKDQYYFVRDLTIDPNVTYIVWRSGKYLELKGNPPQRRIGGAIDDYSAPRIQPQTPPPQRRPRSR